MRPQSAKAKGRRLQQDVVAAIKATFPELVDNDVVSTSMGAGGEDVVLSPAAEKLFPFSVEAKNVEKLNVWTALDQAAANACRGRAPIVVMKKNNKKPHVVISMEAFMSLAADAAEHRRRRGVIRKAEEEPSPELPGPSPPGPSPPGPSPPGPSPEHELPEQEEIETASGGGGGASSSDWRQREVRRRIIELEELTREE